MRAGVWRARRDRVAARARLAANCVFGGSARAAAFVGSRACAS